MTGSIIMLKPPLRTKDGMCSHQPRCPDALAPDRTAAWPFARAPGRGGACCATEWCCLTMAASCSQTAEPSPRPPRVLRRTCPGAWPSSPPPSSARSPRRPRNVMRWWRPAWCRLECGDDQACGGDRRRRPDRADAGGRAGAGGRGHGHCRAARQPGARYDPAGGVLPQGTCAAGRRRRTRALPGRRAGPQHRCAGRGEPGMEAGPGGQGDIAGKPAGYLPCRAASGRCSRAAKHHGANRAHPQRRRGSTPCATRCPSC